MKTKIVFSITAMIVLLITGCDLLPFAPQGRLELGFSPNPVYDPYYSSAEGWLWSTKIEIRETGGFQVELGNYGPKNSACIAVLIVNNNVIDTFFYYSSDIVSWFGTKTIPAYGKITHNGYFSTFNYSEGKYYEVYYGMDENGYSVVCSDTLYLINNTKKQKK